jgi:hypothetical protein
MIFILAHQTARERAIQAVKDADDGWCVRITEPNRTLEQNAAQWPYLTGFSKQLLWPVDGEMVKMTNEEWKDVLTAAFYGENVRLAKGLNGGVVMLGIRTSDFKVPEFSDWMEFLICTAEMRGVKPIYKNVPKTT